MKILVIVPTHNRLEFIPEALASLDHQARPADEVVVTGNVGPGIISDEPFSVRVNDAIEHSDCDAFFILCDDDLLEPTFIEKTVALMEKTGADIVYTDRKEFGSYDFHSATGVLKLIYATLLRIHAVFFRRIVRAKKWTRRNIDRDTVPFITSLCKKSAWSTAGGFDEVAFSDWHFWWKCFYSGATAVRLPEPLFLYRRSPGQGGNNVDHAQAREELLAIHETIIAKNGGGKTSKKL